MVQIEHSMFSLHPPCPVRYSFIFLNCHSGIARMIIMMQRQNHGTN